MYKPTDSVENNRTSTPNKMWRRLILMPNLFLLSFSNQSKSDSTAQTKTSANPLIRMDLKKFMFVVFRRGYSMGLVSQAMLAEGKPA